MLKKFMAAASVSALVAGAASAQLALEMEPVVPAAAANSTIDDDNTYELANEVDFTALNAAASTAGDGVIGLEVLTEGVIPPGQNIFITLQITGAAIRGNLDGSEFGVPGGITPIAGYSSGGVTGAVVNAGGTDGATSVRYLITTDTADQSSVTGKDGVALALPITMTSCGNVEISVTEFQTEVASTPIEGGSADLSWINTGVTPNVREDIPAISCVDAFAMTLVDDSRTIAMSSFTAETSLLELANSFSEFVVNTNDIAAEARLGIFDLAIDTTAHVDLEDTNAAPGMFDGFDATVVLEDDTNVTGGNVVDVAPLTNTAFDAVTVTPGTDTLVLASTATATDADETAEFNLTIDGTTSPAASVMPQAVTVTGATIALDHPTLIDEEAFVEADVEDLKLEGQVFGSFDWVSDSQRAVNTIFRVTGLSTTEDVPTQIIVENSRNGDAFNGVYQTEILGSSVEGSEIRWNSAALEAVAGQFGTADITFVFSTLRDLDVDRLLAGPNTATVVPFGDGANQDGSGGANPTTRLPDNDDQGRF